jgi:hypothetical protein
VEQLRNLDWSDSRGQSSQFTPEKKLAVAVLVDALRLSHEQSMQGNEAFYWLMGVHGYRADWVFSAESICDALKVDLAALRTRLRCQTVSDASRRSMRRLPTVYQGRVSYRERQSRVASAFTSLPSRHHK